jgi:UDP-N-acetylmuramoyl-tripeptide--D-alanyl-D-alanine ligase
MAEPLWTSSEIVAATGGEASADFDVTGLSIDTRSLQAGDLFVALKDIRDGHEFTQSAFEAGASGALVSREIDGGETVLVEDVLPALEALGLAARDRATECYRVAVTGSVGKTSVKEMLARIFGAMGPAHWNVKSFNNHWGVPLTLARMPRDTERAAFEIGMNTPGEIAPRSHMVRPHCALITKIAPAHLEGLGSVEGVAREKADIFAGLLPGGFAIVPFDDDFAGLLTERAKSLQPDCRILTFGMGRGPDAAVLDVFSNGSDTTAVIAIHGREVSVSLNAVGEHWALNAAAALLAACPDSADNVGIAANALDGYSPPPGRGTSEVLTLPDGGSITLIDDAYNANPESMRAALVGFAARPCVGKRIVALGEMLEVGGTSEAEHVALAAPVVASGASHVFMAGEAMTALLQALGERTESIWSVKAEGLESELKNTLKDGDLLLLKGSNASGMGRLADRLRQWSASTDQQVMNRGATSAAGGSDAV